MITTRHKLTRYSGSLAVVLGVVAGLLNLPVKEHPIERAPPLAA